MLLGVGADQRDGFVTQVAGGPHRAKFRVHKVGATAGVRYLAHIHHGLQLAFLGIHHADLVAVIRCHHEVALGRIPAAVVQVTGRTQLGDLEGVHVLVVHHQGLAGFLHVHDELGLEVRCHDGCDAGLRVVFLGVHRHATGRDDLHGLQRVAIHDDELRGPVGASDGQLVGEVAFLALVLGGVHRAGFQANADFRNIVRLGHPQVDHVHAAIAADHEQVAARCRGARDVHRVAGLDDVDDLLGVTVNQRHFARVTQRGREDVGDVVIVHLLGGAILRGHHHLPGLLHVRHAPLGGHGRILLDVAGHHVDIGLAHFTGSLPVGHAGWRTVGNEHLEVVRALGQGHIRRQRLARGTFAQHAVAACATLKVRLARAVELGLRHLWRSGVRALVHRLIGQRGRACLVVHLGGCHALLVFGIRRKGQGGHCQGRKARQLSGCHGDSLYVAAQDGSISIPPIGPPRAATTGVRQAQRHSLSAKPPAL